MKTTALATLLVKYGSLTQADTERLKELESVIERGTKTFIEVGYALAEIRDQRLYRQTHATFESVLCRAMGMDEAALLPIDECGHRREAFACGNVNTC